MTDLKVLTHFDFIGGESAVHQLVDRFYCYMDTLPEAQKIRAIHSKDLSSANDKLFKFLCGWLGGPPLYEQTFGPPQLRMRHLPFKIGPEERDQWMLCMNKALDETSMPDDLREHLRTALGRVAEHMMNQTPPLSL